MARGGKRLAKRVLGIGGAILLAAVVGALAGLVLLTRTNAGQALVLERVLARIDGVVNGEIVVSGLRSAGLHRGARLVGLQVRAPDGTSIMTADSVEVEYSLRQVLRGDVVLSAVTLWQPILTIAKSSVGDPFNLTSFLLGRELTSEEIAVGGGGSGPVQRLVLEDVTIRGGRLEVRYPLASAPGPDSRVVTVPATAPATVPADDAVGVVRTLDFHDIVGHLDGVVVVDPDVAGLRVDVDSLSFEGNVFRDPVRVRRFDGRIEWLEDHVSITAETLRLPGSTATGSATVDLNPGRVPDLVVDLVASRLDFNDLRWLRPDLPDARGSGGFEVALGPDGFRIRWSGARFLLGDGAIVGEGVFSLPRGEAASFEDVSLEVMDVPVATLSDYLPRSLPLDGTLGGHVDLAGTMESLSVDARLVLAELGAIPSNGEVGGVFHLRRPYGVSDLRVRLAPVDLALVNRVAVGLHLEGALRIDLTADGRLDEGIYFAAESTYPDPDTEDSRVVLEGRVFDVGGEVRMSLDGELEPLSIAGLFGEDSPLSRLGVVRGTVHAEGPASSVVLQADLITEGGELTLESSFDARAPLASYRLQGEARNFDARELAPALPEGTVLTGSIDLRGEGGDLRTAELFGDVSLSDSRLGQLAVDTTAIRLRISEGVVIVEAIQGLIGGVTVEGSGRLATAGEGAEKGLELRFETDDVEGLRPFWLGPNVIAQDTLSALSREILAFDGIDPDTLPALADVQTTGRMTGRMTLSGSLTSLVVAGEARLDGARYGGSLVDEAEVTFGATGLMTSDREIRIQIDASSIRILDRAFDSVSVRLDYRGLEGAVDFLLARADDENYRGRLVFERGDSVQTLHVDELALTFPDERWNLGGPTSIAWDSDGLTVSDFRLIRPGVGGMRVRADGRLPFQGEADFALDVQGLDMSRVAHVLQLNERLEGVVNLNLRVTGDDAEPVMAATLAMTDFRYRDYVFDQFDGVVDYSERRATGDVELWKDSVRVLTLSGELPLDLTFHRVDERLPDETIDLQVIAEFLPLSLLMVPFDAYQDVEGTISGRVTLGGTTENLAPTGSLTVDEAGALLRGLGVRHRDINATLDWFPDGRVEVDATLRAVGTASVQGTIALTPASDPDFDLDIQLDGFQAMNRRDVTGVLSGDVQLQGSYRRPVVSGDLFVDEGTIFVDEFQRLTAVVDLADPAFEVVDTTVVDLRPLLGGQNPFLRNIRMENMNLTVQRDSWIRSDGVNVELDGQLQVLYDRQTQDLALVGALEAVRGSYEAFGRQFQVDGGTMRFLGTPGINPDLDITASNRIRSAQGERFTITAAVTGTLVSPRVGLTSDEAGLTQDDLLSYLYFGRPTYALTSGQSQALGTRDAILGSVGTFTLRQFSNQLGATAQGLGLGFDYVSISQQDLGVFGGSNLVGALETTVVETGFYVADDFFLTLLFRPWATAGAGASFPGIRLEWAAANDYTIETYIEDRFFRGRVMEFGDVGFESAKGLGLFIFRDWVY